MEIEIKTVSEYPQDIFDELVKKNLESQEGFISSWNYHSEGDSTFRIQGKTIRIGAYHKGCLIGLSWGRAESKNRFMMHMSLVEEEYRSQGIYGRMLKSMIELTKEFDEVDSWHHILNNRILSFKLKNGFHIVGFDNSTMLGPRVRLRYFHNQELLEIMRFRCGLRDNPVKGV